MKKNAGKRTPRQRKEQARPKVPGNRRLAEQTRKLLGKHYASKYRAR